jgi:hypothetical protein
MLAEALPRVPWRFVGENAYQGQVPDLRAAIGVDRVQPTVRFPPAHSTRVAAWQEGCVGLDSKIGFECGTMLPLTVFPNNLGTASILLALGPSG